MEWARLLLPQQQPRPPRISTGHRESSDLSFPHMRCQCSNGESKGSAVGLTDFISCVTAGELLTLSEPDDSETTPTLQASFITEAH